MIESARLTASLMEAMPDAEDRDIIQHLVSRGIPVEQAHELIAFTPLAFARRAMKDSGVKFQDSFVLLAGLRTIAVLPLESEAAYCAAWAVADEYFSGKAGSHNYLAIAGRSAELRVINGLLQKGSKLENIATSQPLIELPKRKHKAKPSFWKTLRWLIFGS